MSYRYRLLPRMSQRTSLAQTLAIRTSAWEEEQRSVTHYDTIKMLPRWKAQKPQLREVRSQVLQEVCIRLERAFQAFTRRVKTGEKPGYPRTFRGDEKELAKAQRKLPKAEKRTPDRARCGNGVVYIHQRTTDRRKDFAHKLARQLMNEYGVIALEKLNGVNLLQNHRLARYISDAAWSQLVQPHTYKAGQAGREALLVDPNGTWQRCSGCAMLVNKNSLCLRVHTCPGSGLQIERDINAPINILTLERQRLGVVLRSHRAGGAE